MSAELAETFRSLARKNRRLLARSQLPSLADTAADNV
jgi:hypothetical protein